MFQIDTACPRWRRVAVAGLALPLSLALSGTASANESLADLTLTAGCFDVLVTSDKDISNVKITFTDGTSKEFATSGYRFEEEFDTSIAFVSAKSGTKELEQKLNCAPTAPASDDTEVEDGEDEAPVTRSKPAKPVTPAKPSTPAEPVDDKTPALPSSSNGTAVITITVDCDNTVSVVSDKDISNVKVTFADGTTEEIEGLSGRTFERDFAKDIESATAKSATTEVPGTFVDCEVTEGGGTPVVDKDEDEDDDKKDEDVDLDGSTGGGDVDRDDTVGDTTGEDADETPVVADETPDQSTVGTPIAGQPVPQSALGGGTPVVAPAPVAGPVAVPAAAPAAQAPTAVAANGAVTPTVLPVAQAAPLAQAGPAQLPFTGTTTDTLVALGGLLVLAGGGAIIAGRPRYTPRHAVARSSRQA